MVTLEHWMRRAGGAPMLGRAGPSNNDSHSQRFFYLREVRKNLRRGSEISDPLPVYANFFLQISSKTLHLGQKFR